MTINNTIAALDELRPNAASAETKAAWTIALDGRLRAEVLGAAPLPLSFPEDADAELSAAEPYGDLYVLWCAAQLDLASGETARYFNSMSAFEKLLDAFKRRAAKDYALPSGGFRNVRL
ncbi:MAG: hypothetical protein IJU94_00110 [Clostridia bacterium]|nr:hypothetical protein [Kiritimatiellia bacterium]MBQ9556993.1 hypothetical protein [Clostridia bacterium]